jgi:glyoxylase-like metal-dependent hydrolase (beta-lactamase superfamily II)
MEIKAFTFNPFQENTFVLFDETGGECAIVDPGCNSDRENSIIADYIDSRELKPKYILLTHAHIDHILGLSFMIEKYGLIPFVHPEDDFLIDSATAVAQMYGLNYRPPVNSETQALEDNMILKLGNCEIKVLHCPGHSPGGVCFYCEKDGFVISGDVLFHSSIGRTDLPGGQYDQLIESIQKKLMVLADETVVYPGHMEFTTIGYERYNNPFL